MTSFRWLSSAVVFVATIGCGVQTIAADADSSQADSAKTTTDNSSQGLEEVVVTGTFIRGSAPVGADVIGVSSAEVQQSGATTTSQLLETIPQMGSFNSYQGIPP